MSHGHRRLLDPLSRRAWLRGAPPFAAGLALGASVPAAAEGREGAIPQPAIVSAAAFMARAVAMRRRAEASGDQPYGAVLVRGDRIVGEAASAVIGRHDPTAHAEMEAIRDAARRLGTRDLAGSVLFSTSRPCAMCEAAAYWAGVSSMIHGEGLADAGTPRLGGC